MSESENADDFEEYTAVEDTPVDAIVRKSSDEIMESENSYSFDPLGQQLSSGSVGDLDVSVQTARHREEDTVDIVVGFGDGSSPDVHFDGNALVRTAIAVLAREGYEQFEEIEASLD